jgi:hypothetical protein
MRFYSKWIEFHSVSSLVNNESIDWTNFIHRCKIIIE